MLLANNNKTEYKIYCDDDYAYSQFISIFLDLTGAKLERASTKEGKTIVIEEDKSLLKEDSYRIKTRGDTLKLTGSNKRGVLYAIFTFFQDYGGCRWLSSDVNYIPKKKYFKIGQIDLTKKPYFWYREVFYKDAFNPEYALKNKLNGKHMNLEDKHGGKIEYGLGFVHTFHTLISPEEYSKSHPEYFPLINGKREWGPNHQLCLTNPDVIKITIEKVKETFDASPDLKIVSISQSDTFPDQGNNCQCSSCKAIDDFEGSPSGSLISFVNKVADAIRDEYPGKYIDTLAYRYTRKAPLNIKVRDNVIIRLCTIECCFSHPLMKCNQINEDETLRNESFIEDLKEWSKICNNIFIWDYIVNFLNYLTPYPNLYALQENLQFYAKNNVKGVFSQGCGEILNSEFSRLRAYVIGKLLEDPYCDLDLVIDEFIIGCYQNAGGPIRNYLDRLNRKAIDENFHFGLYDNPSKEFLNEDFLAFADRMFDRAEALADDETILFRVQRTRMSIKYAKLFLLEGKREEKLGQFDKFFDDIKKFAIDSLLEGGDIESSYKRMKEVMKI